MPAPPAHPALLRYVDDEMLRAPLLADEVVEATLERVRRSMLGAGPAQRSAASDLLQAMQTHRRRINEYFVQSLRRQTTPEGAADEARAPAPATPASPFTSVTSVTSLTPGGPGRRPTMALVDEESVAVDVELARTIEEIRNTAEYELRELQTYTAALVGDMEMAHDHNPFGADTLARALWAGAQALPLTRGFQVAFLRHARTPLATLLRKAYASSASRLESEGVEPAAYRTLILPPGSRRGRLGETTFAPDLLRIRDAMPVPAAAPASFPAPGTGPVQRADANAPPGPPPEPVPHLRPPRREPAPEATGHAARQALELVGRLFDAIAADTRVPADVLAILLRLRGPALQLSLRDPGLLEEVEHPLWRFANRLAYEAEMAPDSQDPERARLLKVGSATIEQLAGEPQQTAALCGWALERLETFLQQRLARRLTAAASQIGALQKLEDRLAHGQVVNSTMHGTLDIAQLDTVPAALMVEPDASNPPPSRAEEDAWLDRLRPGHWLRMFLQGHWVHVQLLWPGERREIWLFGDGASDATWAVRRPALLALLDARLLKRLTQRSLVRRAAEAVQAQVEPAASAG